MNRIPKLFKKKKSEKKFDGQPSPKNASVVKSEISRKEAIMIVV
jgi:hypothetical protein